MDKVMFDGIYAYIASLPVFSDHEHHNPDDFFCQTMSLDRIISNSYVNWMGYSLDGTPEARVRLLENTRFNSYFYWLEKGIQKVHGITDTITEDTWDGISEQIERTYRTERDFHWTSLSANGYERLIQDAYWEPGDDMGHPEIFTPAFRIDKFTYGYHREAIAPNDFIPWTKYGFTTGSLDDYVGLMRETIGKRHAMGKVAALKCAEAYMRSIDFLPDDRDAALKAFGMHPNDITDELKIRFSNYIFNRCCELAAELDIPFQIHTGLARLSGSNPMLMEPLIGKYPRTRFVLFHSGFPWIHEVAGLAHNYSNVLPSLTWTATICTSAAIRALHDYIDVTPSIHSITWGSDCWVPEESVGAMLAWRFLVSKVLSERMEDGRLTVRDAEALARKLMYENGRRTYLQREG